MALCNTVLYSYGKYRKDKFKHYKKMVNHAEQLRKFYNKSI